MEFPQEAAALAMFIFLLGLRHGMDPDHIAAVDQVTRCNVDSRPRLARLAGCLFSLGHGAVVILVAVSAGAMAGRWNVPSSCAGSRASGCRRRRVIRSPWH